MGPAPEMSTLWSQSLTSAMRWQTPPVGDQLVLPRICKGWSAARLNSCNGSGKTSCVTNEIRKSEDAVILQCCGLYSSLGALNIQSLQVKSCFVLMSCIFSYYILFRQVDHLEIVLSSLIWSLKFIENPLKTSHNLFFFSAWKVAFLARISVLLPSMLT